MLNIATRIVLGCLILAVLVVAVPVCFAGYALGSLISRAGPL